ncbi:hypothetical protein HYV82_00740 [Candidatus Woesearchaeota archaeon]|nr:hypothetical protein [Candidatus Woesearchaeota archaeon]
MTMSKKSKKGVEWHVLLMMVLGIAGLLITLYIIYIFKAGGENAFTQIIEKLRFG